MLIYLIGLKSRPLSAVIEQIDYYSDTEFRNRYRFSKQNLVASEAWNQVTFSSVCVLLASYPNYNYLEQLVLIDKNLHFF